MRPIGSVVSGERLLKFSGVKPLVPVGAIHAFSAGGSDSCAPCCDQDEALKDAGKASGPSHDAYCREKERSSYGYPREERERDGCCREQGSDGSTECYTDCGGGGGGGGGDDTGDDSGDDEGGEPGPGPGPGGGGGGGPGPGGPGDPGDGPGGDGDGGGDGGGGGGGGDETPPDETPPDETPPDESIPPDRCIELGGDPAYGPSHCYGDICTKDMVYKGCGGGGGGGGSGGMDEGYPEIYPPDYGEGGYPYPYLPDYEGGYGGEMSDSENWWDDYFGGDTDYGSTPDGTSDSDSYYTTPATGTGGSSDAWGGGTSYPSTGPTGTANVTGTLTDSKTSVNLPVVPLPGGISTIGGSLASLIGGIKGSTPLSGSVKVPGTNVSLAGSDVISKLGGTLTPDGKLVFPARGTLDTLTGPTATQAATAARNVLPLLGLALLLFRR